MDKLSKKSIKNYRGFNFHIPAGYPLPSMEDLKKAWNTGVNGQMDNFLHRKSVKTNYGSEVAVEYNWEAQKWQLEEIFFATPKTSRA